MDALYVIAMLALYVVTHGLAVALDRLGAAS